jgi:nucleotide-binding universal stress UspA family protein
MLRTILVGLDGSPDGDGALNLGLQWAKRLDALLVGLAIIDAPSIRQIPAWPPGSTEAQKDQDQGLLADARRRAEQILERFSLRCAEEGVSSKPLEDTGVPYERILDEATRFDLIVLGRRTHFSFTTRNGHDETLERVLRGSPRPVVTVTERPMPGDAVLVAYDGSPPASRAVQMFANSGIAQGEEVIVLTAAGHHADASRHAERAVDFLSHHQIRARAIPLETSENPALLILRYIELCRAGLVVMGSFGKPAWKDLLLGSVTRAVVRESTAPVFLFH